MTNPCADECPPLPDVIADPARRPNSMVRWFLAGLSLSFTAITGTASAQVWQQMPMPMGMSADQPRDLLFSSSNEMYVSYDNDGLWRSPDYGTTWQSID